MKRLISGIQPSGNIICFKKGRKRPLKKVMVDGIFIPNKILVCGHTRCSYGNVRKDVDISKWNDKIYDTEETAGITFGLEDALKGDYIMHYTDEEEFVLQDYPFRDIAYDFEDIYDSLPTELKEDGIIKTVNKEYEATINYKFSFVAYYDLKLFIPSLDEIMVNTSNIEHIALGDTYEYYKDNSIVKDRAWWVRNLHVAADGTSNGYYAIDTEGNVVLKKGDEEGIGISFAFCI